MQIRFTPNKIDFTFEQASSYYYLQTIVDKNIKSKIGRKNKMIIFPDELEQICRKYLLKLIAKIYKKQSQNEDENTQNEIMQKIKNSYDFTIKLTLELKNQIIPDLKILVDFSDLHVISFKLENNNKLFVNYMKNYFKDHLLQYKAREYKINIFPNSKHTLLRLQKLFYKKEHLAWFVTFEYNLNDYDNFINHWLRKNKSARRFSSLSYILDDYFSILGCNSLDCFVKVRHNYLKLAKLYHPDSHAKDQNTQMLPYYKEQFEKVQTAYVILKSFYNEQNAKE